MAKATSFGRYLRELRRSKGFRSAAALARAAGLPSVNHVAMFERGEYRPRWATAQRIIRALRLDARERDEFARRWKDQGTPSDVRKSVAGPPVPGVALWKHLPGLLFSTVKRAGAAGPLGDQDAMVADVVRATGSVLAAANAVAGPLLERQITELRQTIVARHAEHIAAAEPGADPDEATFATLQAIPVVRRFQVFSSEIFTGNLVRTLANWEYQEADCGFESLVGLVFRPRDLQRFNVFLAPVSAVLAVHDALVAVAFWREAQLDRDVGPLPIERVREWLAPIRGAVDAVFAAAPPEVPRDSELEAELSGPLPAGTKRTLAASALRYSSWIQSIADRHTAALAVRLFDVEPLGSLIVNRSRDELLQRLAAVHQADGVPDQVCANKPRRKAPTRAR